jgi:hypothetical protein
MKETIQDLQTYNVFGSGSIYYDGSQMDQGGEFHYLQYNRITTAAAVNILPLLEGLRHTVCTDDIVFSPNTCLHIKYWLSIYFTEILLNKHWY